MPDQDLAERVERLEALLERAVALAEQHPKWRVFLRLLGLKP